MPKSVIINLNGPDGNSFALLDIALILCQERHINPIPILNDMKSWDFERMCDAMQKHFDVTFIT